MPDPRAAVTRVALVGVSCVGKTTVGRRLADVLACPFIDFDEAIEAHYGSALGRIKGRLLTQTSFRRAAAPILARSLASFPDQGFVLALPPSGLHFPYYRMLRSAAATIVELTDSPRNILRRATFYDDDSRLVTVALTPAEKRYYLSEIRKDIAYYRPFYRKADLSFDVAGRSAAEAALGLAHTLGLTHPERPRG